MSKQTLRLISAAFILSFIFSAALTITVFADEGTPTDPVPTEEATATEPAQDPEATPELAPEETVIDEEVTAAEETIPSEIVAEPEASGEQNEPSTPVTESEVLLAEVPEDSELVLLDVEGEIVSLASEEAAELLLEGDPMWCPVGVTPIANTGGCTASFSSFAALFADAGFQSKVVAGVIWVRDNYNSTDNSWLNGNAAAFSTLRNFALTIKGGWTGSGTSINTSTPSIINGNLWISSWNANVTLSDLTFTSISAGPALQITTTKNVVLTRVKVNNNATWGAEIDNATDFGLGAGTGNVTISSSQFSQNLAPGNGFGLHVKSNGVITLSNVVANGNTNTNSQPGVYLENYQSPTAKNVIISGSLNDFNDNKYTGLTIDSKGLITLSNVSASGNGILGNSGSGASISNTSSTTAQGVTVTGTNLFNENYHSGLNISSDGAIKISTIFANSNLNTYGASINNTYAATAMPITLTGSAQFKYNGNAGAYFNSNGAVILNNINASNNGDRGIGIDNNFASLVAPVTLTGTNIFNTNFYYGLTIDTMGAIALSNITASYNGQSNAFGDGAYLDNTSATTAQKITLSGTNAFNENEDNGLYATSDGPISINSVTANENGNHGLYIESYLAPTPQTVTLTGVNTLNDNGNRGIVIYSGGAIKLNSVTANDNALTGAELQNNAPGAGITISGTNQFNGNFVGLDIVTKGAVTLNNITASDNTDADGVSISNTSSGTSAPQNVTLTGTNLFEGNYNNGLNINTYGAVSLTNITSNSNGLTAFNGRGLYVANNTGTIVKGVTLSGVSSFDGNYSDGIYITTLGPIKLNSVTAINTVGGIGGGYGAYLLNAGSSAQSVILTGTNNFSGNYADGLRISSTGAVSLNSITASNNGTSGLGEGVVISNAFSSAPKVTFTGTNTFNANHDSGLHIESQGAVSLQNINSSNSIDGYGLIVNNTYGMSTLPQAVTLGGTSVFNSNEYDGINIVSYGAITLNNVTANDNGTEGADLNNSSSDAATPPKVALIGTNIFNGNGSTGLDILTKGAITSAFKLTASSSNSLISNPPGALLDNTASPTMQPVTLLGTNTFSSNEGTGLTINSHGTITVSNLTASENGTTGAHMGADLDNATGSIMAHDVKLTGTNTFNGNQSTGLNVNTLGAISISNVTAKDSVNGYGVYLDSDTEGKAITVSGTNNFSGNLSLGLAIWALGPITVNNISAIDNDGGGAYLTNIAAAGAWAVKVTGTNWFEDNNSDALEVYSKGAISANSITSINNATGVLLQNCDWVGSCNPGTTAGITLTGTNYFYGTTGGGVGLRVRSNGAVTLSNITDNGNTGGGLDVEASASVTITCGSFTGNGGPGMDITSAGTITLKGVTSSGNSSLDVFSSTPTVVRSC